MPERVFVMLKPDAFKRRLVGEIIFRIEKGNGLVLEKFVFANPTMEKIAAWYDQKDKFSKKIYPPREIIAEYLCSGPVMPMIWTGENALKKMRKIVGNATNPVDCEAGTIRRDLGIDCIEKASNEKRALENLIHASRRKENIEREIIFWFGK